MHHRRSAIAVSHILRVQYSEQLVTLSFPPTCNLTCDYGLTHVKLFLTGVSVAIKHNATDSVIYVKNIQ